MIPYNDQKLFADIATRSLITDGVNVNHFLRQVNFNCLNMKHFVGQ